MLAEAMEESAGEEASHILIGDAIRKAPILVPESLEDGWETANSTEDIVSNLLGVHFAHYLTTNYVDAKPGSYAKIPHDQRVFYAFFTFMQAYSPTNEGYLPTNHFRKTTKYAVVNPEIRTSKGTLVQKTTRLYDKKLDADAAQGSRERPAMGSYNQLHERWKSLYTSPELYDLFEDLK
jgi:hypothetical protein